MPPYKDELLDRVKQLGADDAGIIEVRRIAFSREFRNACEQNYCGFYGKCWMCPPHVGDIDEMIAKAKGYDYALVYQSIGELEDSYDIEGMEDAAMQHNKLSLQLDDELMPILGTETLRLGAGACQVCEKCTKLDNLPCRFPQKAVASLEAYGIAVSELATSSGMKYINGENTVTYFGVFLFK